MLRLAQKAFWPSRLPVPGHARGHRPQLPRGASTSATGGWPSSRPGWWWPRSRSPSTPAGWPRNPDPTRRATACRPGPCCDAIMGNRFDAVFGGARRDEEKARAKERVFSFRDEFGQWDPKNQRPELWSLYNGRHHQAEHIRVFPLSNWTELDIWQYIEPGAARDPVHLLLPPPSGLPARRHAAGRRTAHEPGRGGGDLRGHRPLPHGRRHDLHGRGGVDGGEPGRESSRRSPCPGSPSAVPPGPTTGSASRPWRTASGRGTSNRGASPIRHRRLGRRRQEHPDRPAALRLQGHLRGPARGGRARQPPSAARTTPTWPCSPTACGPSGSRASPSTSPTATSPRRSGNSSSPTPRATSSTPATWSPGHSTADLALVLVDARKGIVEQTRRHAFLASLLRVPHLVLCVNKMDLVDYDAVRLRVDQGGIQGLRHPSGGGRPHLHPHLGAERRQRRAAVAQHGAGTRARRCCTTSSTSTSPPTAT